MIWDVETDLLFRLHAFGTVPVKRQSTQPSAVLSTYELSHVTKTQKEGADWGTFLSRLHAQLWGLRHVTWQCSLFGITQFVFSVICMFYQELSAYTSRTLRWGKLIVSEKPNPAAEVLLHWIRSGEVLYIEKGQWGPVRALSEEPLTVSSWWGVQK